MSNIAAGRLRHRVEIQKETTTQDLVTGARIKTWVKVADVWAAVEPLSVREFIAADATQSEVSARIVIRHRSDVDATMRIVHAGRYYWIKGVLSDQWSGMEYLTLPVSQGVQVV